MLEVLTRMLSNRLTAAGLNPKGSRIELDDTDPDGLHRLSLIKLAKLARLAVAKAPSVRNWRIKGYGASFQR
jgi:hypothetical protein